MTKRMLIDATHAEETRVVVLDGSRLEDFDVETSTKKQLKGNIYLAKVVRVEPSLQAAFVEYGGNRHGFLAFGEIHPDYYQIPVADRQRLLDMQAEDALREQEEDDREALAGSGNEAAEAAADAADTEADDTGDADTEADDTGAADPGADDTGAAEGSPEPAASDTAASDTVESAAAWSGSPQAAKAQPLRIEIESVEGSADALPPDEDADSFRIPTAAAPGEREDGAVQPAVVATLVAPAAETLPDSSAEVQIAAAQVAAPEVQPLDTAAMDPESGEPDLWAPNAGDHAAGQPDAGDSEAASPDRSDAEADDADAEAMPDAPPPETVGGDADAAEDARERRIPPRFLRNYKIQEVIRRRQILLVQVVKEERGTKGAALTTYISLAGRFCVLMPNSPRGGGISRKITSATDRRRLKEVTAELDIPRRHGPDRAHRRRQPPEAGDQARLRIPDAPVGRHPRTHAEVGRPGADLRGSQPDQAGDPRRLLARHRRDPGRRRGGLEGGARLHAHADADPRQEGAALARPRQPLFARQQVEAQLDAMLLPTVQLRSGGYLVINQTEALVAIDVNSGRSTRERGIEETALRTNLEAADEVARQLRLRDLAGLIVIDFIDMESEARTTRRSSGA